MIIRNSNTVLAINYDNNVVCEIAKIKENNLNKLHIFIFDREKVNVKSLEVMAAYMRRAGKPLILHCYSKDDKRYLKDKLKTVPRDVKYYIKLENPSRKFVTMLGNSKELSIWKNTIVERRNGSLYQQTTFF